MFHLENGCARGEKPSTSEKRHGAGGTRERTYKTKSLREGRRCSWGVVGQRLAIVDSAVASILVAHDLETEVLRELSNVHGTQNVIRKLESTLRRF